MTTQGEAEIDILGRVRRYREAARRAVRADAPFKEKCLVLLDVTDMAREEPDITIRTWAERAIWDEAKSFLGMDDAEPELPHASYEQRARGLGAQGRVACPTCLHPLPTDDELERWARMRRRYAETLAAREQAVES